MKSEIIPLSSIRGIAACYVVLYHSYSNRGTALNHGYIAVDLFFILSGFVMSVSYKKLFIDDLNLSSFLGFLIRRLGRIYPLYLLATVVSACIVLSGHAPLTAGLPLAKSLPYNLLLMQAWGFSGSIDYPAWSISTEWFAYLTFPFLAAMLLRPQSSTALALLVLGTAAAVLVSLTFVATPLDVRRSGPLDVAWAFSFLPVLRCLAEFLIGILTFRFYEQNLLGKELGQRSTSTVIFCLIFALIFLPRTDLLLILMFPLLILSLASVEGPIRKVMTWPPLVLIGELSFAIYLLHPLVFLIGNTDIQAVFHNEAARLNFTPLNELLRLPVKFQTYPLLFLVSYLIHYGFERPLRNASRHLIPKRSFLPQQAAVTKIMIPYIEEIKI